MPLSALDRQLRDDPLTFLSTNAVWPESNTAGQTFSSPGKQGHDELQHVQRFDQVGNQVMLARLAASNRGSYTLDVKRVADVPPAEYGDRVPVYYLPWASKGVTSMTLHPPPPPVPGKPARPARPELEPRIFFTAGLSGCSVFVEGSPRHPTIHHAGYELSVMDDLADRSRDRDVESYWRRVFADLRRSQGAFAEVNKAAYVDDGTRVTEYKCVTTGEKDKNGVLVKKMVPVAAKSTQHAERFSTFLKAENGSRVQLERVLPGGSVFGVRDDLGNWSFYLQRIATIEYWVIEKRWFGKTKKIGVNGGTQKPVQVVAPMEVVRFFPGPGEVALKPFTNVIGADR